MATPLFQAINKLNQKVADIVFPSYIQWNSEQNVWFVQKTGFEKPFEWLNWHRVLVLGYFLWYAVSGIYSYWVWVKYPGILDIQDVALVSLVGLSVIPLVLLFEYGYMKYAVEYCGYDNWGNKKLAELTCQTQLTNESSKCSLFKIVRSEFSKIYHGDKKNVDWWGIMVLNMYVSLYPPTFTVPAILTLADMDLSYIWLYTLSSPRMLSLPNLYENFVGKLFRGIFQGLVFQSSAALICTCIQVVGNNFQVSLEIMKYLKNKPVINQNVVKLYREFYLGQYLVGPLYKLCNTLFLTSTFFVLVFAINLTLLGYSYLPFKMYIMAPLVFVYTSGFVLAVLVVEGFVFYKTSELLSSWNSIAHKGPGRCGVVKKMLRACRPVSFPCGDMGIVDRDIKINFKLAVLDRSIEVMLLFKV